MAEQKIIAVTEQIKQDLTEAKIHKRETFADVVERLLEERKTKI